MFDKNEKSMSMSDSMEGQMQNQMESMDISMDEMSAKPKKADTMPECAILSLIKTHIVQLDEEIEEADKKFARAFRNERYSTTMYDADEKCKILEAKKSILVKVQNDIECMMTPMSA